MRTYSIFFILLLALSICLLPLKNSIAGIGSAVLTLNETDTDIAEDGGSSLFYFFDLRDRETFIQFTFTDSVGFGTNTSAHVQIFNVSNNCNENNFFDVYTPTDTHVYNMRNIQTNDGNPSGVVLPDGAYGFVVISAVIVVAGNVLQLPIIGNFRVIDDNGYEYRTNAQQIAEATTFDPASAAGITLYSFNFNNNNGVILSDVVGITVNFLNSDSIDDDGFIDWDAQDITMSYNPFDIDIINNNEVPFSCRDVIFSCVDEDNPRLEELLEFAGSANVASFEYGINNAIPHSKGGELLCPGNTTPEGVVILTPEQLAFDPISPGEPEFPFFVGYVGLNNGNGRGSMDAIWIFDFNTQT